MSTWQHGRKWEFADVTSETAGQETCFEPMVASMRVQDDGTSDAVVSLMLRTRSESASQRSSSSCLECLDLSFILAQSCLTYGVTARVCMINA